MHNDLVSNTARDREISLLLNAIKCIACKEITTYLSVPITSGKRLLDYWIEKKEQTKSQTGSINSDEHKNKVVLPNLIHAEEVAKKVRSSNQLLIDPSQFARPREFRVSTMRDNPSAVQQGIHHSTGNCPSTCAAGSIGQYSPLLQPALELPDSTQREPAEGGGASRGEGVGGGYSRLVSVLLVGQYCRCVSQ